MRLLFTGASGFLGKNILPVLSQQYGVVTLGVSSDEDYRVNLSMTVPELPESFDVVLHAAGKAHSIPRTEGEKQVFYDLVDEYWNEDFWKTYNIIEPTESLEHAVNKLKKQSR